MFISWSASESVGKGGPPRKTLLLLFLGKYEFVHLGPQKTRIIVLG